MKIYSLQNSLPYGTLGVDMGVNKLVSEPGILVIRHSLVGVFTDKIRVPIHTSK